MRAKNAPAGKPMFGSVWLDALVWGIGGVVAASVFILAIGYGSLFVVSKIQTQSSLINQPSTVPQTKTAATGSAAAIEGAQPGQIWEGNGLGMKFCWCPAGNFQMGSPGSEPARGADEEQKPVTIEQGFWIGKFEVTQSEYVAIVGENPSRLSPYSLHLKDKPAVVPEDQASKFAVDLVSYGSAEAFCSKLTAREQMEGRLPAGWRYILPSEAQWEYACRAGTTGATAFGDQLGSSQANFDGTKPYNGAPAGKLLKDPQPVGTYAANPWGICDMHGNMREWCRDLYATSGQASAGDSSNSKTDAASVQFRVIRGGDATSPGSDCRCARRLKGDIDRPEFRLGFRVVLEKVRPD